MSDREEIGGGLQPPKQKPEDAELDITPMIDITFLLLSFFVVVSKMDPTQSVDLPRASFGEAVSEKESVVFLITKGETKDAYSIFRGRNLEDQIKETEPTAQEEEVGFYCEKHLSSHPEVQTILIKAEGTVKTGAVEIVKRGISLSELAQTRQIYVGVEEQK